MISRALFVFTAIALLIAFVSCSSAPKRSSVHYAAPSTAPVREKVRAAQASVAAAVSAAKEVRTLTLSNPGAVAKVDALTAHLLNASSHLTEADVRIRSLELQALDQTRFLNACVDDRDIARGRAIKLEAQRATAVSQRNKLFLVTIALLIWVFRKPLLALLSVALRATRMSVGIPF